MSRNLIDGVIFKVIKKGCRGIWGVFFVSKVLVLFMRWGKGWLYLIIKVLFLRIVYCCFNIFFDICYVLKVVIRLGVVIYVLNFIK